MYARHRFPGTEPGDSETSIVVCTEAAVPEAQDDDKYSKKPRKWNNYFANNLPIPQSITNFTSSTFQTITGKSRPVEAPQHSGSSVASSWLDDDSLEERIIVVMTSKDRTNEFTTAVQSIQGRNIQRAVNIRDPKKAKQMQSYSEFMVVAKHVGKNIASTYTKLEKLTLLAKKKSLFDDRPIEIQELTYMIKGDLNSLNQQIAKLQDISRAQRTSSSGKHLLSHSSNMVVALQAKLANMSNDFKQILEVRTENLKQQKTRRDQFSQGQLMPTSARSSASQQGNLLLLEQDNANQSVTIDFGGAGSGGGLSGNQAYQQQQTQQLMLHDESDRYVQERAETMQNIESTIIELGGIFQQLAHMVKEQEEMVERIDTNVQDTELNIESAHTEILKYFQSVSKNRWLMIKVFGVLIFFFMFFVIFMT